MTVTMTAKLSVPLPSLLAALKAVKVHAEPSKTGEEVSSLSRVRLDFDANECHVIATNARTSAVAHVEILEDDRTERFAADDGSFAVDLPVYWTGKLVQTFRAARPGVEADEQEVEIQVTADRPFVVFTDVSGLWPGASLKVPTLPFSSDYPDVPAILAEAWSGASGAGAKPLVSPVGPLALFRHAGVAYKPEPLVFEPTGSTSSRGFLVWAGKDFEGHVESHHDADSLKRRDALRMTHLRRHGLGGKTPDDPRALLGAPELAGATS